MVDLPIRTVLGGCQVKFRVKLHRNIFANPGRDHSEALPGVHRGQGPARTRRRLNRRGELRVKAGLCHILQHGPLPFSGGRRALALTDRLATDCCAPP